MVAHGALTEYLLHLVGHVERGSIVQAVQDKLYGRQRAHLLVLALVTEQSDSVDGDLLGPDQIGDGHVFEVYLGESVANATFLVSARNVACTIKHYLGLPSALLRDQAEVLVFLQTRMFCLVVVIGIPAQAIQSPSIVRNEEFLTQVDNFSELLEFGTLNAA